MGMGVREIKIFNVDVSAKWIFFELDGKKYSICFKDSLLKGVNSVEIWIDNRKVKAEIISVYPPISQIIKEIWRIYIPCWFKRKCMKRKLK